LDPFFRSDLASLFRRSPLAAAGGDARRDTQGQSIVSRLVRGPSGPSGFPNYMIFSPQKAASAKALSKMRLTPGGMEGTLPRRPTRTLTETRYTPISDLALDDWTKPRNGSEQPIFTLTNCAVTVQPANLQTCSLNSAIR